MSNVVSLASLFRLFSGSLLPFSERHMNWSLLKCSSHKHRYIIFLKRQNDTSPLFVLIHHFQRLTKGTNEKQALVLYKYSTSRSLQNACKYACPLKNTRVFVQAITLCLISHNNCVGKDTDNKFKLFTNLCIVCWAFLFFGVGKYKKYQFSILR